jgi:anti-anti-sigma factor
MENSQLNITVSDQSGWRVVRLAGRLDAITADAAKDAILAELTPVHPKVAIDAAALSYMSSAGVRVLLTGAKAAGRIENGGFNVLCPSPTVRRVLMECGLDVCLGMTDVLPA